MTARIALICPTRGRPAQFKRMVESAFRTAENPDNIWIYFFTAECDPATNDYLKLERCTHFIGPDWSSVMASNYMASSEPVSDKDLLMVCADDCVFSTPHWDKALLDAYDGKPHVYSLLDSRDPDGTPHPVITREYIKAMGYFMPPIFLHWYGDSWTAKIAKANNCFTHLKDYLLIHDKPSDTGEGDETHKRIRQMGWLDRDNYVAHTCQDYLGTQINKLAFYLQEKKCSAA